MDGEEDETSKVTVNEPSSEVKGGESPAAEEVRLVDVQCEPASPNESVVESLGAESFPPPPAEFSGILGGVDVVGGEERASREEPKDGAFGIYENKEVENEVTSKKDGKDLVNEFGEKEKVTEVVPAVEESAAAEMASEKGGYDDIATLEEMVKDTAPEGDDLANVAVGVKEAVASGADLADVAAAIEAEDERFEADVAVAETETISEKVDLVPAAYERFEANVPVVETEIISKKVDLVPAEDERGEADVVVLETEIISDKVDLVPAEETEMVSEEKSSDEISPEKSGGLADLAANETETTTSVGGGTGTADKFEIGSDEGGLAVDVATGNESREVVLEEGSVTMEEEMETVPEETRIVADVANDEPGVTVQEEGGLRMEEAMETAPEETRVVPDVANDEPAVAVQEEGGLNMEGMETNPEETRIVADVAKDEPGVTVLEEGVQAMEEETETLPEESCLVTDLAAEDETGVVVPEEAGGAVEDETGNLPEENHVVADVAMEEVVPEEGGVARDEETETLPGKNHFTADVESDAETGVVVLEEGGGAMEETGTFPEESQLVADVAPEETGQEADVAPEETGQEADMAPEETGQEADEAVEMNGRSPSEVVKEKEEEEDPEVEEEEAGPTEEGVKAEETDTAEPMEEDEEPEQDQEQEAVRGKRKRGKSVRATPTRVTPKKKTEEDVCFICFDGGELVLCDRRGCPKAYHPTCVNRDDAFFRSKGRWNCGWHLCSTCGKNAYYMCYTCTFSLCKTCVKGATILCVRGNKGFCETCMRTVKLIEKNEGNMTNNLNFNDKSSWEYLFKDYYTDLKESLSLTLSEIAEAKNPRKGSDSQTHKQELAEEAFEPSNDVGSDSDDSFGNLGSSSSKRKKARKRGKSRPKDSSRRKVATSFEAVSDEGSNEWASKELLEFVMHMRDGDDSVLTQFDVQALLLEYIKRNKLRDPRRKSQIICDSRLENIFRKPRVGHFEMLKLLESHFLIKEEARVDDAQGSVVDTETSQLEADGNSDTPGKSSRDKKRKSRRKGDGKGPQSNLDDYAAIDTHNINLIYLRRNLVEDLIDDAESFHNQAVGAFVRIRIAGNNQKQDLYRLVQVVGTSKAAEPYKVGKKVTDICLEILNLDKNETVSMDIISNQEFTEEECKRLRQSIKCGLINRLTVGDVQEKAIALQAVRVKDWLESEIVRLSHLRDRASETGRRKDLRECVEKLQLLKTPEERQRRLEEIPEIHTDPKMDPSYESEEEEDAENKRREKFMKARGFGRRGRDPISPRKSGSGSSDAWSGTRSYSNRSPELNRNLSGRGFSAKIEETTGFSDKANDSWSNQGRDREKPQPNAWEKPKLPAIETGFRTSQSAIAPSEPFSPIVSETLPISIPEAAAAKINESEKIWFYKDPSGKIQGPFSIVQLRKWNATGYFPSDLRIWKQTETQNDSLLLTDVLAGKIQKEKVQVAQNLHSSPKIQVGVEGWRPQNEGNSLGLKVVAPPAPVEVPKIHSSDGWISTNLPSPTPSQTPVAAKVQPFESVQSKPEQILAPDIQSVVSNLQSLVQSVASHLPPAETQGWVKPEMAAAPGSHPPPSHGHQQWNNDDAAAPANFNAGAGFQSTAPPPPQPQPQPTNHHWQPQVTGSVPNPGQPQNSGWGPPPMAVNQNMGGGGGGGGGWGGGPQPPPPQQNPNMNWGNPWGPGPPNQGSAPPAVSGWGPPPPPPQVNANQGWQGPPQPGNNSGWNQGGSWDRGHNQDPGYGGKPWSNRQQPPPPPFSGGSSRPPFRGQRVCKYHESGHCKKGASCDYLHS